MSQQRMLWIQISQTGEVIRVIKQRCSRIQLHLIRCCHRPLDNQFTGGIQNGISTCCCLNSNGRTIDFLKTGAGHDGTPGIQSDNLTGGERQQIIRVAACDNTTLQNSDICVGPECCSGPGTKDFDGPGNKYAFAGRHIDVAAGRSGFDPTSHICLDTNQFARQRTDRCVT